MAELRGALKLSGLHKSSETIFVETKNGFHTRTPAKPGIHKDEPVLKKNYTGTAPTNALCSSINSLIKNYARGECSRVYTRLQKLLKKNVQPELLSNLKRLEGFEGHPEKPMAKFFDLPDMAVMPGKDKLGFIFTIRNAPEPGEKIKFYYLQIIMAIWNKDKTFTHSAQRTQWISMDNKKPLKFKLEFPRATGSREYLVLACCARGEENREKRLPPDKSICVMLAGSFDKKAMAKYAAGMVTKPAEKKNWDEADEGVAPMEEG